MMMMVEPSFFKSIVLVLLVCGSTVYAFHLPEQRIAGGDLAHEQQFPYQVGISIEIKNGLFSWCGGALISQHWVMTAAHCVDNIVSLTLYLGSVKRLEPAQLVRPSLKHIHIHAHWQPSTLENDIALIYMPTAVSYTQTIRAIALPKMAASYSTYVYREAIATGWGRLNDYSTAISNELRYVVRYVDSNEDCQRVYGASMRASNICIDTTGGKSTCTGDSGGPLAIQDPSEGEILIGLTSFGKQSGCTKGYPAVFTRITSYLQWIRDISGVVRY